MTPGLGNFPIPAPDHGMLALWVSETFWWGLWFYSLKGGERAEVPEGLPDKDRKPGSASGEEEAQRAVGVRLNRYRGF